MLSKLPSTTGGPQSIGMDISFTAYQIYGLPEHTNFALKSTNDDNSDPMSIYSAVPYIMTHQPNLTTAVLWLNGADTWIDVEHQESSLGAVTQEVFWDIQKQNRTVLTPTGFQNPK